MGSRSGRFLQLVTLVSAIILLFGCQTTKPTPSTPITPPLILADSTPAGKNIAGLKNMLPVYEAAVAHPWPTIPGNKKLALGAQNDNVLLLRQRLLATQDLMTINDHGNNVFDTQLADAVKLFQRRHGLKADGYVGQATLHELNISPEQRVKQIELNIQRWESLSHEMGHRYIMVNVPDYHLDVVEDGKTVLSMKAIIGKPERQTPELSSVITRVILNPYWNVPKKIAQKDIVPKVINDPDYLDDEHIKILQQQTDHPAIINAADVDWLDAEENGFKYHFRQDPGVGNALGLVKFEFTNSDDIYLHDTPAKNLFDQDKRAFSSGCIRLEKPFELANYLMRNSPEWNDEHVKEILEIGKTSYIKAAKPTTIIITYITAWVDEYGLVEFRDDLYGRDAPPEQNNNTEE